MAWAGFSEEELQKLQSNDSAGKCDAIVEQRSCLAYNGNSLRLLGLELDAALCKVIASNRVRYY